MRTDLFIANVNRLQRERQAGLYSEDEYESFVRDEVVTWLASDRRSHPRVGVLKQIEDVTYAVLRQREERAKEVTHAEAA